MFRSVIAALLLVPVSLSAQQPAQSGRPQPARAERTSPAHGSAAIAIPDLQARIGFLASDSLRGRNTPSPGLDAAAAYVAAELERFGLEPAGENATFFQYYPQQMPLLDRSAAAFRMGGTELQYGRDFFLVPGPVDSVTQPAFYVGTARPEMELPAEMKGRIVVAALPGSLGDQATMQSWQAGVEGALIAGMRAGAAAVVLVLDTAFTPSLMPVLGNMTAQQRAPLILAGVTHQAVAPAFRAAGLALEELRASEPAAPVAIPAPLMLRSASGRAPTLAPNVAAVLRGSDPALRDQYVVLSAHMDHVGVGAPDASGDSIYNGADDDASGVSAVLEVAQALAAAPTAPRRSVLFLLVSGEEKGLLGSQHFAAHPTVPLEQIVADINIDMIGRNHPDTVVAIGKQYTDLGSTVEQVASAHRNDLKLVVPPDLWPEENLFLRSDHYSFAARGIPAIFFTTGLHADYHRPSDEPDTIDYDKLTRISRLIRHLTEAVANADAKPQWTAEGRAVIGK